MRAFIGIDFSKQLKNEISALQKNLKNHATTGRWKYAENFHITLKFLEDITGEQLTGINREMQKTCMLHEAFKLKISEIGNFAGKGCIRVLWLGMGGELDRLKRLQFGVEESLAAIGLEKEKREYRPHITIGQDLGLRIDFDEVKKIAASMEFQEITVDRVFLFKSEQVGNKRVYTPLSEFMLK